MSQAEELLSSLEVVDHEHEVDISVASFTIDPTTKDIISDSGEVIRLVQGSHKSTRFSFTTPRYIGGHDMILCNHVNIPYINSEPDGRNPKYKTGVYMVNDLQVAENDDETVTFSWLVTINATSLAGALAFMVILSCMKGKVVTYRFPTNTFEGVYILPKIDSAEQFEYEYVDVIEQWKSSVMAEFTNYIDHGVKTQIDVAQITKNKAAIEKLQSDLNANIDEVNEDINTRMAEFEEGVNTDIDEIRQVSTEGVGYIIEQQKALKARMDAFTAMGEGSTTGDAELNDLRVGVDGTVYENAGAAVRGQFEKVNSELAAVKNIIYPEMEIGSVDQGIYVDMTARARIVKPIKYWNATVYISQLDGYFFGYTVYDTNGNYDKVDHGWTIMNMNREIQLDGEGSFTMNFMRSDTAAMTEEDLALLSASVRVEFTDVLHQIDLIKEEMASGFTVYEDFAVEVGSVAGGEPVDMPNRARLTSKIALDSNVTLKLNKNSTYFYGYAIYDTNGVYDGVDHGWTHLINNVEFNFAEPCYIRMNFQRTDSGVITEEDLATITSLITIIAKEDDDSVVKSVRDMQKKTASMQEELNILNMRHSMNSIDVEYGREYDSSYVFVRIPKTTNQGKTLVPKVRLTSPNGIPDGKCLSTLAYAKVHNSIFAVNAGLFDMTHMVPVGQTIIDGESITNIPMQDDNGTPISDIECYPLCIDANGDLSASYPRSVDTSEMLADGIVQAVTGWGKVIDNFKACPDTVENEIVHGGKYIRQSIGQFQNGDYFVCTIDMSRGTVQNEAGITYENMAQLLIDRGVKFAYSLDGGGSSETVIGNRQLNPIYEGVAGRPVPTVITFEESDE